MKENTRKNGGKIENGNEDDGKCSDERGLVINNRWKNRVGTKE